MTPNIRIFSMQTIIVVVHRRLTKMCGPHDLKEKQDDQKVRSVTHDWYAKNMLALLHINSKDLLLFIDCLRTHLMFLLLPYRALHR